MSLKKKLSFLEDEAVGTEDIPDKKKEEQEGLFRYSHLSDDERTLVDTLLRGRIKLDEVPKVRSNVVKMFISSTFTDMEEERNSLVENVYPKLRELCRNQYGVDFQPVDMRWGVPIEAGDDHSAVEMCLSELRHCQLSSLGPNFVAFIGQRYGWVPLPSAMYRAEYEVIEFHVRHQSKEDAEFMNKCYLKDQNVHPNVYRLQPISFITEFIKKPWREIEVTLKRIIKAGGESAMNSNELSRASYKQLTSSVTEQEIYEGLIGVNKQRDRDNNAILYIRDFTDLHRHVDNQKATRYIDVNENSNEIDVDAKNHVDRLKGKSLEKLTSTNTLKSMITWKEGGIDRVYHQPYIKRMCSHFLSTASKLVERNISRKTKLNDDSLYYEVVQHWNILKNRCKTFVGRDEEMAKIKRYILSNDSTQPLVVHGPSGSGKTSLLAKIALESPENTSVIVRFLGTTPGSSSIQQLLFSICHQLAYVTGQKRSEVPEDFSGLKVYFRETVRSGDFNTRVLIILDALNQLSSSGMGYLLDWLPARHSCQVRIIVSTLPESMNILNRLRQKINDNFVSVEPLAIKACEDIFKALMDDANRKVTYKQWKLIQKAFQSCSLPLFVTLTFHEVIRWFSYDNLPDDTLKHTVEESIHQLFNRLEKKHGQLFVARSLGYITAAKDGLSESELEDILSLDDEVLNSVFLLWAPPIRRLPPSLWSRLHLDIDTFLVRRDADGSAVLSWYHQQFENVVKERYLSDYLTVLEIHTLIEQYYMGTWANTDKSFKYMPQLMQRLGIKNENGKAYRCVPKQPMVFEANGVKRYNVRKLNQVPYSLFHSRQLSQLKEKCLFNYEWIYYKLKGTSLQKLLADYSLMEDRECGLIASALRMAGPALAIDAQALIPELVGRLLPHCSKYPYIQKLVKQCDISAKDHCSLIPNCQTYTAPGGPLQYEREINAKQTSRVDVDVFSSSSGVLVTAKSFYNQNVQVWEVSQGEPRQDFKTIIGQLYPSNNGKYLSAFRNNKFVMVFKSDGGEMHGEIDYDYGVVSQVETSDNLLVFITDVGIGPYVVDIEKCVLLHKFSYNCSSCAIGFQESFLAISSQNCLYLYEIPIMTRRCMVSMEEEVKCIQFTTDKLKCFALTQSNLIYSVTFDLNTSDARLNDILVDFDIKDFNLSHTEKYLLVRAARCLYVIDQNKDKVMHRLQKMPGGAFVETMSTFSSAGFTSRDDMIVASRYTYIAVWKTSNGCPLRLLIASVSPINRIYTCSSMNKVVSVLKNHTLQVWDMDNLDADVQHSHRVVRGRIDSLAVSSYSKLAVCCSNKLPPEVTVVRTEDGEIHTVFQYSDEIEDRIFSLEMSPMGKFCVARGKRYSNTTPHIAWKSLSDDVIYDMNKEEIFHVATNSRYALFDRKSSYVACVQCSSFSPNDYLKNSYLVSVFPTSRTKQQPTEFKLPANTEFICPPVLFASDKKLYFVTLVQSCEVLNDPVSKMETGRLFDSRLSFLDLSNSSEKVLTVKSIIRHADENDRFVYAKVTASNKLLLFYAGPIDYFPYEGDNGLVCPPNIRKGAILYDPETDYMMRHVPFILTPCIDISSCSFSKYGSIILTDQLKVFKNTSKGYLNAISAEVILGSGKLALDGQYLVALCKSGKMVLVIKTDDGEIASKLFVHGHASCLQVAEDDMTVVVGCSDGRVMILTLILDTDDPFNEIICKLASRKANLITSQPRLLEKDLMHVKINSERSPAQTLKAASNAVFITQHAAKWRSRACSIQ